MIRENLIKAEIHKWLEQIRNVLHYYRRMLMKFLVLDPRKRRLPQNVFLGQTNPPVILSVLVIILMLGLPSRFFFVEHSQNIRHDQ